MEDCSVVLDKLWQLSLDCLLSPDLFNLLPVKYPVSVHGHMKVHLCCWNNVSLFAQLKKNQACSISESGSESKKQWLLMYKMLIVTLLSSDITNV